MGDTGDRHRCRAHQQERPHPHGRHRDHSQRAEGAQPQRGTPLHHRGRHRRRRRPAHEVSLPRPAPLMRTLQSRVAPSHGVRDTPLSRLKGLPRSGDPRAHQVDPRGRTRLRSALAHEPRTVLRTAPVAPDIQTVADGKRI